MKSFEKFFDAFFYFINPKPIFMTTLKDFIDCKLPSFILRLNGSNGFKKDFPVHNHILKYSKRLEKALYLDCELNNPILTFPINKDKNFNNENTINTNKNKKLWKDLEVLKVQEIIKYIQEKGWEVILLPHSFHSTDILANDYEFLKKCLLPWVKIASSMQEVYKYYSQKKLDLCLAERLHSMILSEVYSIPFVWFVYGKKTQELLK